MTLTDFLAERYAEDEYVAQMAAEDASAGANWHAEATCNHSGHAGVKGENGEIIVYDEGSPTDCEARHIARHDPARVLREVEAGRKILAEYDAALDRKRQHPGDVASSADLLAILRIVKVLAGVWSDHPDYGEALRP